MKVTLPPEIVALLLGLAVAFGGVLRQVIAVVYAWLRRAEKRIEADTPESDPPPTPTGRYRAIPPPPRAGNDDDTPPAGTPAQPPEELP